MGDGGGETQSSTTIQKSEPPEYAKPYLEQIYSRGKQWYEGAQPQFYPGQTLAPESEAQKSARSSIMARAMAGSPLVGAAKGYVQDTLEGRGFDDALFRNVESKIKPSVNSTFSAAGRYGSGAHTDSLTRGLTEAYSPIAAQQMQFATQAAPQFAQMDYQDMERLAAAGGEETARRQAEINADIERFNFGENRELSKLGAYSDLIYGGLNGYGLQTGTQTVPQTPMWQQLLSIPFAGLGAAANLGWSPFS